jgi:hypothetical protein
MTHESTRRLLSDAIATALDETFAHVHGMYLDKGTSLFETLDTVSAAEASQPVSDRCASIAAQVAHTTYYLNVLHDYMLGKDVKGADWGAAWRTVSVNADEWQAQKDALNKAYLRVRKQIFAVEAWDREELVGGALAIVVHSAYHLGEIRQALCTLKKPA